MNKKIIIPVILLTALISACGCPPGMPPPAINHIYLLAETPQPAEIGNAPIVINTTEAEISYNGSTFHSFPECKYVPLSRQDILSQFPELTNKGEEPIYSFNATYANFLEDQSVLANLEKQFPDFARLKYAYRHDFYSEGLPSYYHELLISDEEITDPLSGNIQRWTEGAEFAKAVVDELCDGEFVGCKYVTVIEPGETENIVANYFADED